MRAVVFVASLASACASGGGGAPISYSGGAAQGNPAPATIDETSVDGGLSAFALRPEDVFAADPTERPRSHRVREGETLQDVATRYQIPMLALIESNGLEPPYAIAPGRELRLPRARIQVVEEGDTLQGVADRFGIDPRSLALFNRRDPAAPLVVGARIALPDLASAADETAAQAAPAPRGGALFVMPLHGRVVGRFGPQSGGGRSDGIAIAGRDGDPVHASAPGVVVYAGEDVPGYGTLVLIRHANNYVSAYGFNRRALVREGDTVAAGAAIAELGARADGRARLLFQVRQGARAVDPMSLLGP